MTEKYLMANDLRLAYDEFGDPTNPAIVLIMGLGTQMIAWPESFCEELAANGYRVIRFDNRDIGLSQKIEPKKKVNILKLLMRKKLGLSVRPPYTLRDMALDGIGVLDFLEIKSAHWVGASMGGMIAQIIAAEHPERCLSLTSIMSTSGNPNLPQTSWQVRQKMLRRPNRSDEQEYLKQTYHRRLMAARRSYSPTGYIHQMAAILESGDRRGLLRKIKAPTLVIHGKADVLIPVEGGVDTAEHISNAKLELFEGMGHDLPKELQPKFIRLICEMIKKS